MKRVDEIIANVEQDWHVDCHGIVKKLNINYQTVLNSLKKNLVSGFHTDCHKNIYSIKSLTVKFFRN